MNRILARSIAVVACAGTLVALGGTGAHAAPSGAAALAQTSCSGGVQVGVDTTGVTVTGTVTCDEQTVLKLATTLTLTGLTSTVTGLVPALPDTPVPIDTTIPAVGVTAACTALVDTGTGATVSSDCSA